MKIKQFFRSIWGKVISLLSSTTVTIESYSVTKKFKKIVKIRDASGNVKRTVIHHSENWTEKDDKDLGDALEKMHKEASKNMKDMLEEMRETLR